MKTPSQLPFSLLTLPLNDALITKSQKAGTQRNINALRAKTHVLLTNTFFCLIYFFVRLSVHLFFRFLSSAI